METGNHARKRLSQRNLTEDDIAFIMQYGRRVHAAGAIFFQLLRKRIPKSVPANDRRRKLEGATVLTCKCGEFVITAYRNGRAFKRDSRKAKYDISDGWQSCPNCGNEDLDYSL